MLLRLADYKGVIIFYLLLGLILFALSQQSKIIDNQMISDDVNITISQ